MPDETEQLANEKIEQIAAILKDKKTDLHIGHILAKALDSVNPEKGMLNYYLEQIDNHGRAIGFEKRIEYFDGLFNFLEENGHTKDNSNTSEHDSAWFHKYDLHSRGKVRKVIVINNMMGSLSHIFVKEEMFIGDEDYSKYYILKAYDNPDKFLKEDCGRKSLRSLIKNGKLRLFEEFYADGDRRFSFDDWEAFAFDSRKYSHDYEKCILRYDCRREYYNTYYYFNTHKNCEYALGQLESAFWMRTE